MNKKKVGITQRIDRDNSSNEFRDAVDQRLINWVDSLGFLPITIPNSLVDLNSSEKIQLKLIDWLNEIKIDAIILSGGNDIGVLKKRDLTEENLLYWAEKFKVPVLGICRGMQMMGHFAGENLSPVKKHVGVRHHLKISDEYSGLIPTNVNSYHNFALKQCPKDYEILALAEDDNIEAIKHKILPWEGWMWHPEREINNNKIDNQRLEKLVNNNVK